MPFPPPSAKQSRVIWFALTTLSVCVLIALLCGLVWGLGIVLNLLSPVLWPVAISGILAYLLDPVVDFFERKRVPRRRAIFLVFICGIAGVGALAASVVPRLIYETSELVADMPAYTKQVQTKAHDWLTGSHWGAQFIRSRTGAKPASTNAPAAITNDAPAPETKPVAPPPASEPGWEKKVTESFIGWLTSLAPKVGAWLLSRLTQVFSFAGTLIGLAMVPVFTYYFLQEKKSIQSRWTDYLPVQESKFKQELVFVLNAINDYLIVFFRGQVLVGFCIGVLLTIGFVILGLDYAVLLGVLAGVLSIVPYLGALLTIVPSVLLAAVQFKDWLHPVLVIAIFALVQMAEGLVISPKIMGDRVGLHPLTIILAVLVGTTLLGGLLGGVLAIPFTAALRVIMFRYVWKKRDTAAG